MRTPDPINSDSRWKPLLVVRRHSLTLAVAVGIRLLLAAAILVGSGLADMLNAVILLGVLVAVVLWATLAWAGWYAQSFTLSSATMTFRWGLFVRSCRVIAAEAVQDVTTQQSPIGMLFGYGTVDIRLRSGALEQLPTVPDPQTLRDHIVSACLDTSGSVDTWVK